MMSHPTDELDTRTQDNIAHARRRAGSADYPLPFSTIGALLSHRASETPDKNFLTAHDENGRGASYTYREFDRAVSRVASLLSGPLGLHPGERLATLMVNDARTVVLYFAAWRLGVCVVPINGGEDDQRVRYILENSEAKALFLFPDQANRIALLRDSLTCLRHYVTVDETLRTVFNAEAVCERPSLPPPPLPLRTGGPGGAGEEEPEGYFSPLARLRERVASLSEPGEGASEGASPEALIVYTSGTTGAPKGVVLDQGNLLADAQSIAAWHRFGPNDRAMNVLPIHHVNGITVTLLTPLVSGGSVVLNRKFRAQTFWQMLADEQCTWTSVVPTVLAFLCERGDDLLQYDLRRFRHIICGAGPLTTELAARFDRTFGVRVVHGYGLSETTCYSCFLPIDLGTRDYVHWMTECGFPSIGCPIDVNEMAIYDSDGNALPPGKRGEIVIRGCNVMRGYFMRPEANRDTFAHGWFRSGDEGYYQMGLDGRPYFFITGRLKELIIRGGVNYSPFDIDEVLCTIPGVKAAMAVGFENNFYGEEIGAYVQLEAGADVTEETILAACRERLPFAKSPKVVVFGDTFPVTSTGKYQRLKLRPLFVAWKDAEFRERKS